MLEARNIGMNQMNTAPDSWSLEHAEHKSYTKITVGQIIQNQLRNQYGLKRNP